MEFSQRLKELRLAKNYTQKELAAELNITTAAISAYELGNRTPSLEGLQAMAQLFGVSVDYLTGNSHYYSDPQAAALIQQYFERPELKILFDAAQNVSKDDVLQVASLLEKLQK